MRLILHAVPAAGWGVYTHTYHSGVPQVQSVPAEALREAVRLLTYAVFVGFNAAMRRHRLP